MYKALSGCETADRLSDRGLQNLQNRVITQYLYDEKDIAFSFFYYISSGLSALGIVVESPQRVRERGLGTDSPTRRVMPKNSIFRNIYVLTIFYLTGANLIDK
jgi:hypothetical protein